MTGRTGFEVEGRRLTVSRMGRGGPVLLMAVLAAATGCLDESNPCPPGQPADREADRCVPVDTGAPFCSEEDVSAWAAFHRSDGLVAEVTACGLALCDDRPCEAAPCLADAAGVEACEVCVGAEADCGVRRCTSACRHGENADCRRCLCEAGCTQRFLGCAESELPLCVEAYGDVPGADDLRLDFPTMIRRKSETGFTRSTPFIAEEKAWGEEVQTFGAIGWTRFVPLTVDGVDYVAAYMGRCGDRACPFHVAPVLEDGQLGRPVYVSEWTIGWDVFTTFRIDGDMHLVAHKSGASLTEGDPRGATRVLRLRPAAESPDLDVSVVDDRPWSAASVPGWSHLRGFAGNGTPHVLQYRSEPGEQQVAQALRVVSTEDGLRFDPVDVGDGLEPGLGVVETFPVGSRWFVATYAEEEAGTGRLMVSELLGGGAGSVEIGLPLISEAWPAGIDRIAPFRTPASTYFFRQAQTTGEVAILRLPSEIASWADVPGELVLASTWGTTPPWNVVAVARARLWEAP
ncbi:MAG: hypothetical protein ACOCXM_09275 [Myxococcota bacterium]